MGMGTYDTALQMFVQAPRPVDMSRLTFLRWLAEHGKLEHQIEGPSTGDLIVRSTGPASKETPLASALLRDSAGASMFTADFGVLRDGMQLGARPEGGQSFRFRR